VCLLKGTETSVLPHGELERRVDVEGRELLRQLIQDRLDLRARREVRRTDVVGADEVARTAWSRSTRGADHHLRRGRRGAPGLPHAGDAQPVIRRRGAEPAGGEALARVAPGWRPIEATRGSFDELVAAISRASGVRLGKRQVEELAAAAAVDVAGFYTAAKPGPSPTPIRSC